jgi:sugar phosphate permease
MLGGAVGQFAVAPLIHAAITWQQFWVVAGLALLVVALLVFLSTPSGHDVSPNASRSLLSMFSPYRVVLANPQSYLCGFTAGLLFVPTTIGDMIWGVPFLHDGLGLEYAEAVDRAAMVPLGWVIGCPLLGYIADRIGRRKPVVIGGAVIMLITTATLVFLPGLAPPYLLGLILGVASGAAMIPYSIIKEVNPDEVKGSATGAINFLVFTFSALLAPTFGWELARLSDGGKLTLEIFQHAHLTTLAGIALAIVLACFLRETGSAARLGPIKS